MNEQLSKKEIRLLKHGDRSAIERWFNAYADTLYTFVFYRIRKNHDKAVEIVQETLLTALHQIDRFNPEHSSMFTWLSKLGEDTIMRSTGSQGQRHLKTVRAKIENNLSRVYRKIATELLPDEVIERQEMVELVQITLSNIPADYRNVLKEYYYGMRPLKEIADSLGANEKDVKATLYRARKAFKQVLLKLCSVSGDTEIAGEQHDA